MKRIAINSIVIWCIVILMIMSGCKEGEDQKEKGVDDMKTVDSILSLTLNMTRSEYIVGEKIIVTLTLKNEDNEPIWVNKRMALNSVHAPARFREVNFVLIGPSSQKMDFLPRVNIGVPKTKDFVKLHPGESVSQIYDISWAYNVKIEGAYSIQAFYENHVETENPIWKGHLASNIVTFTVRGR